MDPIVISFYTRETFYEEEVKGLIASCEKFGMQYSIDSLPNFGSWEKNCCFKPKYILRKLEILQTPVLWLDADAIIWKKPRFEIEKKDLALYSNPALPNDHPSKVNSGTLLFYPTQEAFTLLKDWDAETERLLKIEIEPWDQISLRNILFRSKAHIHFFDSRYCRIFTKIETEKDLESSFFIHFQASRTLKKILNREVIPFWNEQIEREQKRKHFIPESLNEGLFFQKKSLSV